MVLFWILLHLIPLETGDEKEDINDSEEGQ